MPKTLEADALVKKQSACKTRQKWKRKKTRKMLAPTTAMKMMMD